jgi:hypothetical protein
MRYISPRAAVLLWFLGVAITSTAVYLVYSAGVRYVSGFSAELLLFLLLIAGAGILVFWGFALSRGVLDGTSD